MSLRSMTGYGRGSATGNGLTVTVEISSVNRKQLDVVLSMPRGMNVLEARITETLHGAISRGRVMIDVSIDWSGGARRRAVRIDTELAEAYVRSLREAARKLNVQDDISLQSLVALPDVLHFARPQEDLEAAWTVLQKALIKAVTQLNQMRRREGLALSKDLVSRIRLLERRVAAIRKLAPGVVRHYREQLKARLAEAGVDWQASPDRLLKEIALYADRCDISEELTRLDSHLQQAKAMTSSKEATGRSLDFLAQELFREINTVGSKANHSGILQQVVEFKAELERMREQVQNIE